MDTISVMPLGKALSEVGTTLIRSVGGHRSVVRQAFVTVGKHLDEAGVVSQDTLDMRRGGDPSSDGVGAIGCGTKDDARRLGTGAR